MEDIDTHHDEHSAGTDAGAEARREAAAQVFRVTWAGLVVNLLLAGLKLLGGWLGNSRTVVADAVHSLSDMSTDVAILIGARYWSRPADRNHPYGHRRIETLVTTFIGLTLTAVAAGIVYSALAGLRQQHLARPSGVAFAATAISILTKEILYRWSVAVGRRVGSPAVVANAWHHRSDCLSSIPAAATVAGAWLLPTWSVLDHVGAVVVALLILHAAWRVSWPALTELVDAGVSPRETERIRGIAAETPGVNEVHRIRTRYVGTRVQVDLHILVDGSISVRRGHEISEAVQRRLLAAGRDLTDVVVHIEPRPLP